MTSDAAVTEAKPARSPPSRFRRWTWRIARIIILIYLGLCIVFYAIQESMMFPGRSTQGQKHAQIRESKDGRYELVHLTTSAGDKTVALFGRALDSQGQPRADASKQPTMMFFYGNGMCLADCFGLLQNFQRVGLNVIIAEYVGYGMSSGKPSETTLYATADAVWDHLQSRSDIDRTKIIAGGWSLGAAVAVDTAVRRPVIGLATFSAFTSTRQMARMLLPWLPTSLMLRHHFDNLTKIAQIKVPIFIAHGEHDSIIPREMSLKLAAAAKASPRVTAITLKSDHGDLFETQEAIYDPFQLFVDSLR